MTTSVGWVGALQPGDTATVRWRDGLTQITGRVVSVKRMTASSWRVLFSGMPSEVRVSEGSWSFVSGESPT